MWARFFDATKVDTDAYSLTGSWYFAGLSDEKGPRARAAFVDRASVLNIRYATPDISASASIGSAGAVIH